MAMIAATARNTGWEPNSRAASPATAGPTTAAAPMSAPARPIVFPR